MAFKGSKETTVVIPLDQKHYTKLVTRAHANDRTAGREAAVIVKKTLDEK